MISAFGVEHISKLVEPQKLEGKVDINHPFKRTIKDKKTGKIREIFSLGQGTPTKSKKPGGGRAIPDRTSGAAWSTVTKSAFGVEHIIKADPPIEAKRGNSGVYNITSLGRQQHEDYVRHEAVQRPRTRRPPPRSYHYSYSRVTHSGPHPTGKAAVAMGVGGALTAGGTGLYIATRKKKKEPVGKGLKPANMATLERLAQTKGREGMYAGAKLRVRRGNPGRNDRAVMTSALKARPTRKLP